MAAYRIVVMGHRYRQYTSGVNVSWTSTDLEKFADTPYASPLLPVLDRMPFINQKGFEKNLAFSVGQNIYTPDDTEAVDVVKGDRPYAGWLYLGLGVVWKNAPAASAVEFAATTAAFGMCSRSQRRHCAVA